MEVKAEAVIDALRALVEMHEAKGGAVVTVRTNELAILLKEIDSLQEIEYESHYSAIERDLLID